MAFLSALFSELDTDLEAEAARHILLWELFWPQNTGLSLPPASLVPGCSLEGQKASPFVPVPRSCKYNTE